MKHIQGTRLGRVFIGSALLTAPFWACGESRERREAGRLDEPCTLDSDCAELYECIWRRCHDPCAEDRDCKKLYGPKARCVRVPVEEPKKNPKTVGVCQLPHEAECEAADACQGAQICVDGQCLDACDESSACLPGLACFEGACEPEAAGAGGAGSGPGPAGGSGGRGGSTHAGGTGASAGEADSTAGGATGAGGEQSGAGGELGSGGTTSGVGGGGEGGDSDGEAAGAGGGVTEPAGSGGAGGAAGSSGADALLEDEPNETLDQPNELIEGERIGEISSQEDVDTFVFAVPPGSTVGGYFKTSVVDIRPGAKMKIEVRATVNGGTLLPYPELIQDAGRAHFGYLAAAPDAGFAISVAPFQKLEEPFEYRVRVDYVPLEDSYEPNQSLATAKPIDLGETVHAHCFAGLASSSVPARSAYDDWYAVQLEVGTVAIELESVPENVQAQLVLHDSTGAPLRTQTGVAAGLDVTLTHAIATAGTYYVKVGVNGTLPEVVKYVTSPTELPDHFLTRYALTVSQE